MTVFCGRGGGAVTRGETLAECLKTMMIWTIRKDTKHRGRLLRLTWIYQLIYCSNAKPVDDWVKQTAHWGPTVNENDFLICQKYVPSRSSKILSLLGHIATATSLKNAFVADLRWGEGNDMSSCGGGWTCNNIWCHSINWSHCTMASPPPI